MTGTWPRDPNLVWCAFVGGIRDGSYAFPVKWAIQSIPAMC